MIKIAALCILLFPLILLAQEKNVAKQKIDELADQIKQSVKTTADTTWKKRIAVISFSNLSEQAKKQNIGKGIAELLTTNLVQSEMFLIIEREELEKVLKEQAVSLSGIIDPNSAIEVGKILGAEAILCGTVAELGEFYDINARMIDAASGQVLLSAVVDIKRELLSKEITKYVVIVEKRSPVTATALSLVLPGLGQYYNNQYVKGVIFEIVAAIAIGGAIKYNLSGNNAYGTYEDATTREEALEAFAEAQKEYDKSIYAQYVLAGIWSVNIADALLFGMLPAKQKPKQEKAAFKARPFFYAGRGMVKPGITLTRTF